ncbi:hypothetical protein SUGI_0304530 [Cryptomeria japonica]|nr:hypothetical protein SUGI_0304530 [Cryptomeria japonica]
MIYPNCTSSKDRNSIFVTPGFVPIMSQGAPHICISCRLTVMDMDAMYDDIGQIIYCNARSVFYMNIGASTIDCLVIFNDKLLLELNNHISLENNLARLGLNNSVSQSAMLRIDRVIVIWIRNYIKSPILTSDGIFVESNSTVS